MFLRHSFLRGIDNISFPGSQMTDQGLCTSLNKWETSRCIMKCSFGRFKDKDFISLYLKKLEKSL